MWKVDQKAMIRNRYNRIPHSAIDTKRERNTYNILRRHKVKIRAERKGDYYFPADGHQMTCFHCSENNWRDYFIHIYTIAHWNQLVVGKLSMYVTQAFQGRKGKYTSMTINREVSAQPTGILSFKIKEHVKWTNVKKRNEKQQQQQKKKKKPTTKKQTNKEAKNCNNTEVKCMYCIIPKLPKQ